MSEKLIILSFSYKMFLKIVPRALINIFLQGILWTFLLALRVYDKKRNHKICQ